jgi:hypothetical protein
MAEVHFPKAVLAFFREAGARGGEARAKHHSKAELSKWGKMGGRPKKSDKKQKGKK